MPGLTHTDSEERKQQILSEFLSAYILKDVKSLEIRFMTFEFFEKLDIINGQDIIL